MRDDGFHDEYEGEQEDLVGPGGMREGRGPGRGPHRSRAGPSTSSSRRAPRRRQNDLTPDGLESEVKDKKRIGRQSNVWNAFGYRYVMPQTVTWKFSCGR